MGQLKTDTWYAKYPGDYLKDTLALTLEEDGFFNRALDQVYILRGRIPADPVRLQLLLRVSPEQWERCRWIMEKFFYRDGDSYGNRRADEEIAKAQANAKIAQENGKRGGRKPGANPDGTQPVTRPVPPPEPSGNPAGGPGPNPEGTRNESSSPSPSPLGNVNAGAREPGAGPTPKQEYWDGLCAIFGITPTSHQDELRLYDQCAEFRRKGASMAEIRERAAVYRQKWPDMAFTVAALLRNWDQLRPAASTPASRRSQALSDRIIA